MRGVGVAAGVAAGGGVGDAARGVATGDGANDGSGVGSEGTAAAVSIGCGVGSATATGGVSDDGEENRGQTYFQPAQPSAARTTTATKPLAAIIAPRPPERPLRARLPAGRVA